MSGDDGFGAFLAQLLLAVPEAARHAVPVAVGWGTVELERAVRDFEERWPGLAPFDAARDAPLLGAVGRVSAHPGRPAFVLLEPVTEGRLAATLARHGEGPVVFWVAGSAAADRTPRGEADGAPGGPTGGAGAGWLAPRSEPVDGPFGPERLLTGTPVTGPHVLLLGGPPGTIER